MVTMQKILALVGAMALTMSLGVTAADTSNDISNTNGADTDTGGTSTNREGGSWSRDVTPTPTSVPDATIQN